MIGLEDCRALDARDPLAAFKARFAPGEPGTIYLDGNSIGPMPADVPRRIERLVTLGWRDARRRGWQRFDWLEKPWRLGEGIAHIVGAGSKDVIFCDSTTVNLFKLLAYAWRLRPERPVIVTEAHNFPTDLYVAEGLVRFVGGNAALRRIEEPDALGAALGPEVGILCLSHVDYRSSRRWNMAEVNRVAEAAGVFTLWDLSHSAGAIPADLSGTQADFAVGCGYKYLCGGPGAPAWLYVHPRHQDRAWPVIAGWMGHADVFAFAEAYEPVEGVRRQLTGSPGILANEAMAAAVDIWREVRREDLAWKHRSLSETLVALLEEQCGSLGVEIASPRDYEERGGHVAFRHPGAGAVTEALLAQGVVGSFRKPDSIRFGLAPLALSHEDLWHAVARLRRVLESGIWREERYRTVSV
ncbi:MAG: aminotransferase class V-fold PLP-dependent enzyme [Burkholderiales bacterium]|nr:aminotransferase class V-fold PLP-dependent enzyme [Burkholderiales bacterium]